MLAQRFLRDKCGLSARIITRLKREKDGILMDGKILRTIDCVQSGKTVSIAIPDEKCEIEPTKGTLDIRYEDEHFLVVNKPHSMPVHPVKQHQSDTLANIVSYYCSQNGKPFVFRAINRLDKDTSGLVLIAKNRFTANAVKNKTHKVYYALCVGIVATKIGFIKMSVQTTIVSAIIIASCSANVISTMSYTNFPFLFLWGIMAIISIISYCNIVHKTIRMDI